MNRPQIIKCIPKDDHPDVINVKRNRKNVESCLDGMTNGDKLLALTRVAREIAGDVMQGAKAELMEQPPNHDQIRLLIDVHQVHVAAETLLALIQKMDLIANPDRYDQIEVDQGGDPV